MDTAFRRTFYDSDFAQTILALVNTANYDDELGRNYNRVNIQQLQIAPSISKKALWVRSDISVRL
jgi:hypothetical protein